MSNGWKWVLIGISAVMALFFPPAEIAVFITALIAVVS